MNTLILCLVAMLPLAAADDTWAKQFRFSGPEQAPYFYSDEAGTPVGAFVDLMGQVCTQLRHSCSFGILPMARAAYEARNGRIDGIVGVSYNPRRDDFLYPPPQIFPADLAFLGLAHSPLRLKHNKDIEDITVGAIRGSTSLSKLQDLAAIARRVTISEERDVNVMVRKLASGRYGDRAAIFGIKQSFEFEAKRLQVTLRALRPPEHNFIGIGFSKKSMPSNDVAAFRAAIKTMSMTGAIQTITERHGLYM